MQTVELKLSKERHKMVTPRISTIPEYHKTVPHKSVFLTVAGAPDSLRVADLSNLA